VRERENVNDTESLDDTKIHSKKIRMYTYPISAKEKEANQTENLEFSHVGKNSIIYSFD
jgi:hypothetical protein